MKKIVSLVLALLMMLALLPVQVLAVGTGAAAQEEMDAQPQALLTYLIRSLRRRGLRISQKALVNSLQRESIPDAYAELFAGLQGEEESFEDYAPKAVRIPGAHYEQMSLF